MKIYVIGIGPGGWEEITPRAVLALKQSDAVVGYSYYIELIKEMIEGKTIITNGMTGEVDRCQKAIDYALTGKTVAVVSSGDAGIYGMASIIFELAEEHSGLNIEVIPGITAACSGAGVLGAPIAHDFAVISLSDLLTEWTIIEKRIALAAEADFVICLYNPSSKKRSDYLKKACKIIRSKSDNNLACGIVENISRDGENYRIMPISELKNTTVNMFTTVFIGNSQTKIIGDRLVTPRGYLL